MIKETIGKTAMINSNLPERCIVNEKSIFDEKKIANKFKIVSKLAEKTQSWNYYLQSYIGSINTKLPEQTFSINELKEGYFFLKSNKNSGIDDINAKVIRHCFSELVAPIKHIFDLSLSQGIFPD